MSPEQVLAELSDSERNAVAGELVVLGTAEIAAANLAVTPLLGTQPIRYLTGTRDSVIVVDVAASEAGAVVRLTELDRAVMLITDQVESSSSLQSDGGMLATGTNSFGSPTQAYAPAAAPSNCQVCSGVMTALSIARATRCSGGVWAIVTCVATNGLSNVIQDAFCDTVSNCPAPGHLAYQSVYPTRTCGAKYCDVQVIIKNGSSSLNHFGVDGSWAYAPTTYATGDAGGFASAHHSYVTPASYTFGYNDSPYTAYTVRAETDWPIWTPCSATVKFSFGVHWNDGSFISTGYGTTYQKPRQTDCPGYSGV